MFNYTTILVQRGLVYLPEVFFNSNIPGPLKSQCSEGKLNLIKEYFGSIIKGESLILTLQNSEK